MNAPKWNANEIVDVKINCLYSFLEKTKGNSCSKDPPRWSFGDDGKEVSQETNSRVKFAKISLQINSVI